MDQATPQSAETSTTLRPCPNPRCMGSISAGEMMCPLCGHELAACPNCGRLMDRTIGLCGACRYQIPKPGTGLGPAVAKAAEKLEAPPVPTESRVSVPFKSERRLVTEVMAEAYRRCALAGADMMAAVRTLERVRTSFLAGKDAFEIWQVLDEEIGTADVTTLQPMLVVLRKWFDRQLITQQQERLRGWIEHDQALGWREWLRTFAEALSRWRLLLCQALVDPAWLALEPFSPVQNLERTLRLIFHERWTEVYKFFQYLGGQDVVPPCTRAHILVSLGQIHLYHFRFLDQALTWFQQAQSLAPNQGAVLAALASYHQENGDLSVARTYCEQAMQAAPDRPEGYVAMGDLAARQGKHEEASSWYQTSITKCAYNSTAYTRLISVYAGPGRIEKYGAYIPALAERAIAVDETGEYSAYVSVGDAYSGGKGYDQAHSWYQKAIQLDSSRSGAYISRGLAYVDEGESKYDAAQGAFEKAIEVAPEAYAGYWQLGLLCESRERWKEAAYNFAKVGEVQPEFRPYTLAKAGRMQWQMGDLQNAEASIFEALRLDPTIDVGTLVEMTKDYDSAGKPDEALRIFAEIRKIKGDSDEASHQNRLGNFYYAKKEYKTATQHYSLAIQADPKTAVYYSNLAGALRRLRDWKAVRELWNRSPAEIREDEGLRGTVSSAWNDEGNEKYDKGEYGRAIELYTEAIALDPKDAVLRSNLAGAWELNPTTDLSHLDSAISAVQEACRLAPDNRKYGRELERLQALRRLVPAFGAKTLERVPVVTPIAVEVAGDILPLVQGEGNDLAPDLQELVKVMRTEILERFGVHISGVRFRKNETGFPNGTYVIFLMEVPLASDNLSLKKRFCPTPLAELRSVGVQGEVAENLFGGLSGTWVPEPDWEKVVALGKVLWTIPEYLVRHLQLLLEFSLGEFVGNQETYTLIDERCPDLRERVQKTAGGVPALTRILRALLVELVPVAEFRSICEGYIRLSQEGTDPVEMVEQLRRMPGIVEHLPGNLPKTDYLSIGPSFRHLIETGVQANGGIPVLVMEPEPYQRASRALREAVAAHPAAALFSADPKLRPFIRKLVELEFPQLPVLSKSELRAEAVPVGQVEVQP